MTNKQDRALRGELLSKQPKMTDRRIVRTKKMLLESLMTLMIEKGYEEITVQHIIDHADVGRSTFYTHFLDKQDLLQSGINQLKQQLTHYQEAALKQAGHSPHPFHLSFTVEMFRHAQDHYDLYRSMVGKQSGALVQHLMKEMFCDLLKQEIASNPLPVRLDPILADMIIQYAVSSLVSLLTWWLDQRMPFSAVKMDDMFHALTTPGIAAMLGQV